jgi:hypothetical protein
MVLMVIMRADRLRPAMAPTKSRPGRNFREDLALVR